MDDETDTFEEEQIEDPPGPVGTGNGSAHNAAVQVEENN